VSIGVVVLSSGRRPDLGGCLEALSAQGKPIDQIVVVKRRTKSVPIVDAPLPVRTIVVNDGTRAHARNAGASVLDTDVLAFLDADTQVAPDWVESILQSVADGGGVIAGSAASLRNQPPSVGAGDLDGRNGFLPWASAGNLAVTCHAFAQLGGFEAALPALEDADLCFRAQLRGFALHLAPATTTNHSPTRGRSFERIRSGRAEGLLQWRFRANPYFAVVPRAPDRADRLRQFGRGLGRAELLLGRRPVPDLVLSSDADRYVVMPITPSPRGLVITGRDGDLAGVARRIRDKDDLSFCAPGLEADALAHWDEPAPWALKLARSAHRAGWKISIELAAKRLEQEHPRTWGEAFLLMGAVLAWYEGRAGYVLAVDPDLAAAMAERLPGVPIVELDSLGKVEDVCPDRAGRPRSVRIGAVTPGPAGRTSVVDPPPAASRRDHTGLHTPPDPLIFVSGCPRSGTTMLRNMLAAHPALAMPPEEAYFITRVYGQLKARGRTADVELAWELIRSDPHFRAWRLDVVNLDAAISRSRPASYAALIRIVFEAAATAQGKALSGDKCTSYSMHWKWMAEQFPTSRFVHLLRDPRDVCASLPLQFFHHGGVAGAAWWWLLHVREAPRAAAALGSRWLEIRFEDLVSDPAGQLRTICDHVVIPYDESMTSYAARRGLPAGSHHHTARQSPQAAHRGWRRSLDHDDVVTVERITGRVMRRCGYEPETSGVTLGAAMTSAQWILEEAKYQWLLCNAPRPAMFSNLLRARWRAEV
jgi:GT2 family glycosyltransferase